jgi:hypothetical protein
MGAYFCNHILTSPVGKIIKFKRGPSHIQEYLFSITILLHFSQYGPSHIHI